MSLFGGSASQTAFGANSGDVLTKTTAVLVALFMLTGLGMAFIKRQDSNLQKIQQKITENPEAEEEKAGIAGDQKETTPGTETTPGIEATQQPAQADSEKK